MSFTRRNFLIGAGSGLSVLVLTACTPEAQPEPTPVPTRTVDGIVPAPAEMARSAWGADSFARGSVSYLPVGATPDHREALREPLIDRVFFAGEASAQENAGTVLGAVQSGNRAALDVDDVASSDDRVAVIGAGAAGAEAARVLRLRGYDVVVIEAKGEVGGRVRTVTDDAWPFPIELGAWRQYAAADAELLAALADAEVSTLPLGEATVYRSTTGEADADEIGGAAVATALAWAGQQSRDVALDSAIDDSGAGATAESASSGELAGTDLLDQHLASVSARYGADASALSGWFTTDSAEPPTVVTGGFASLVEEALDGVETFLSTTVLGVAYTEERVSLRLGTGESLAVDRVVVTVPLGVLQDDGIEFDPLLPFTHRAAISALGMGTVDTVWLKFDEPFWSTDAVVWNLVGTDDDVTCWYNLQPFTGEPILVGLVGGEAALRTEELDDQELIDSLLLTLVPFAS
jgi:monoamine oxidase